MDTQEKPSIILICGPTASGKTPLSLELARHYPVEIISADSRQVYRHMDIGTAKVSPEEQALVPHHLIDVVDPDEAFDVSDFVCMGRRLVSEIQGRGCIPLIVGGTGLYIKSLTEGLIEAPSADETLRADLMRREQEEPGLLYTLLQQQDPEQAVQIHANNLVRIVRALEVISLTGRKMSDIQKEHSFSDRPYHSLKIALGPPRPEHFEIINQRTLQMVRQGLFEETEALLAMGYDPQGKAMRTLGYRESVAFLKGELSQDEAVFRIQVETRRYAKRQLTWFKKDHELIWVDSWRESDKIQTFIDNFMLR